jgi:hypothetical protein
LGISSSVSNSALGCLDVFILGVPQSLYGGFETHCKVLEAIVLHNFG